jgi:hypothetical protein
VRPAIGVSRCFARQVGQDAAQLADVGVDDGQRVAHLQHVGAVHDVLGRRAPVHVAPGLAAHLDQLVHQRQDRVADDVGLVAHVVEVDASSFDSRAITSAASLGMTPQRASARASATSTSR